MGVEACPEERGTAVIIAPAVDYKKSGRSIKRHRVLVSRERRYPRCFHFVPCKHLHVNLEIFQLVRDLPGLLLPPETEDALLLKQYWLLRWVIPIDKLRIHELFHPIPLRREHLHPLIYPAERVVGYPVVICQRCIDLYGYLRPDLPSDVQLPQIA